MKHLKSTSSFFFTSVKARVTNVYATNDRITIILGSYGSLCSTQGCTMMHARVWLRMLEQLALKAATDGQVASANGSNGCSCR